MIDSDEIRENLLRIRESQKQIMSDLQRQQSYLSTYLQPSSSSIHTHELRENETINFKKTFGSGTKKKSYLPSSSNKKERMSEVALEEKRQYLTDQSPNYISEQDSASNINNEREQYSFSLSDSKGDSLHKNPTYNHSSKKIPTLHKEVLEANYLKIQELLLKQRSLQEESHILQQENEALLSDYREIKKKYYQQQNKLVENEKVLQFVFDDLLPNTLVKNLLLEEDNKQIIKNLNNSWRVGSECCLSTENRQLYSYILIERFLKKVEDLLKEEYVQNRSKIRENQILREKGDEIEKQLKIKIEERDLKIQKMSKTVEQISNSHAEHIRNLQRQHAEQLKAINTEKESLLAKIERVEAAGRQNQEKQLQQINRLETTILNIEEKYKAVTKSYELRQQSQSQKNEKISELQKIIQVLSKQIQEKDKLTQLIKIRNLQLQDNSQRHLSLNNNQNVALHQLREQLSICKEQIRKNKQISLQNMINMKKQEDLLREQIRKQKEINNTQSQFHKREIENISNHLNQVKKQYNTSLAVNHRFTQAEVKYKELCQIRLNIIKMNSQVDHLWNVKEVEYENVMEILSDTKKM